MILKAKTTTNPSHSRVSDESTKLDIDAHEKIFSCGYSGRWNGSATHPKETQEEFMLSGVKSHKLARKVLGLF